ncbi:DUF4268 domain-containing protein [Rhodobacter ferrooxidans]|uniref:DUF4268 domain-containing protein n=1 Tax=Rhodobacter ferrooxidans TaxID=371731 RepID=C8S1L0_9RHOB|nr:DUF4268 domain-containing protein [Rhodobacter sp. SW2]EEW25183.1 conserved hypothetical protein [Rhodobacter sp. SW2]
MSALGRLQRIASLRQIWQDEARDFTPWLAQPDNLAILAETLGFGADGWELEAVEMALPGGGYRADILCRDTGSPESDRVLIENQFGKSDHDHLGKLLTYASGLQARTVVLIGEAIRPEHRAALDWLNSITSEDHRFFACELELWHIGDSLPAPRFNVVVEPNDWARRVIGKVTPPGELSDRRQLQLAFWEAFETHLGEVQQRIRPVKALAQNWIVHGLGKTGVNLNAVVGFKENWLRAEVYLTGPNADAHFQQLAAQRSAIETDFGQPLIWDDTASKDRRIAITRNVAALADQTTWPAQHRWLAETLGALHRTFHARVKALQSPSQGPELP